MSSDYLFTKKAIREFEKEHDIEISLKGQRLQQIQKEDKTYLSIRELRNLLQYINERPLSRYVTDMSKLLQPISLSLFVVNDTLWKIMEKKKQHADRMNPMITFPWFHWDMDSGEGDKHTQIIRKGKSSGMDTLTAKDNVLTIAGMAGDFAGVLEERIVRENNRRRPILIPTGFGSRELKSKYNLEAIEMTVNLNLCDAQLYPKPDLIFDYRFSENPEDIHNHGLKISSIGEGVTLSTGGKAPVSLQGSITIFLCKRMKNLHESSIPLKYHLWMMGLYEIIERAADD